MMMLKFFVFLLCTTALSSLKLQGLPTSESQDFSLSESVLQGQEIHELRHTSLNRTSGLGANGDKEAYYKKKNQVFVSNKSKAGKGGVANIPHNPGRQAKNAASSLVSPPFFLSTTVIMYMSLTVIFAFPSLLFQL